VPAGQRLPAGPQLTATAGADDTGDEGVEFGTGDAVLDDGDVRRVLADGELELVGRITASSNATFLCTATAMDPRGGADPVQVSCVYKPVRGERPLWDFPDGTLAGREVATHLLSEAFGWGVVPPTLLRDGPFGTGMVQSWVHTSDSAPHRPDAVDLVGRDSVPTGFLTVLEAYDATGDEVVLVHADDPGLRRMAVLDIVANNADRKGGHVLRPASGGHIRGCDHGLTFHTETKLRTVLWGFAGRRLRGVEREALERVAAELAGDGDLAARLRSLVRPAEVAAARRRATSLLRTGRFPEPSASRSAIPWPAF